MRIRLVIIGCSLLCCLARSASALGCNVTSSAGQPGIEGGIFSLLDAINTRSECLTDDAATLDPYQPYLHMAQAAFVIHFSQSMEIVLAAPLPTLHGHDQHPLVLVADAGVTVRIVGQQLTTADAVRLADGGDGAIIDGLQFANFPGTALDVQSDDNTILRTRILHSGSAPQPNTPPVQQIAALRVQGRRTHIIDSEIAQNLGPGILVSEDGGRTTCDNIRYRSGEKTHILQSRIHDNGGDGVIINAFDATLAANEISHNARHGVFVVSESVAAQCASAAHTPITPLVWHTAHITQNRLWNNGDATGHAIEISSNPLPAPVDLICVSPLTDTELVVIGNVSRPADPLFVWNDHVLDFSTLHVEIFLNDGSASGEGMAYLLSTKSVDPVTRQFIVHIPKTLLRFEGRDVTNPVLTATLVDEEHGNTSPFAVPLDVVAAVDWDGDHLSNAEEDLNHDGTVDVGETNPRLIDSDGDGLTDGEERLLIGNVAARIAQGLVLRDSRGLNPRNADSDGDCLPDGLEIGIRAEDLPPWQPTDGSVLQRPRSEFSPACLAYFREKGVVSIANAVPWDPTKTPSPDNVTAMFDTDATVKSRTDPTNADTDGDGLADGHEDWNLDGERSSAPAAGGGVATLAGSAPRWIETDATLADSDGDGLPDGAEGDRDGDGKLGPDETNPLAADTDGDGIQDADETRKYDTHPNLCDSDGDGLSDGLEAGLKNPYPENSACVGLQAAGSNFERIGVLDPIKTDSDNDGIPDGTEDSNHNGWLDAIETDPTTADTDGDGMSDYIETTGDLDHDGLPDIPVSQLQNGNGCSPPVNFADADCDGLPNARDDDSDNDGCPDAEEPLSVVNAVGVPAAYDAKNKACLHAAAPSPAPSGGASTPAPSTNAESPDPTSDYYAKHIKGGGGCSLIIVPLSLRPYVLTSETNPPPSVKERTDAGTYGRKNKKQPFSF